MASMWSVVLGHFPAHLSWLRQSGLGESCQILTPNAILRLIVFYRLGRLRTKTSPLCLDMPMELSESRAGELASLGSAWISWAALSMTPNP